MMSSFALSLATTATLLGGLPSGSVTLPARAPIAALLDAALPDESFAFGPLQSTTTKSGTLVTPGEPGGLAVACTTKERMTRAPSLPLFTGCTVVPVDTVAPDATTLTVQELLVLLEGTVTP